jgi:hypothetical protein
MSHQEGPNANPVTVSDEGVVRRVTVVQICGKGGDRARVTNGGLDVNIQDQFTPAIIAPFHEVAGNTTVAVQPAIDDRTITVTSSAGMAVGNVFIVFNADELRFTFFKILVIAGNVITVDSPVDFAYPVGSFVDFGIDNLNVDGSGTTRVFGLRGGGTPPGVDLEADITRIILTCQTTNSVDLSKFGDIVGGITNGLVLRRRDGIYRNIFNVKDNQEISNLMFDFNTFDANNINQGRNGFIGRLTFAGQNKLGVTIRLGAGEDLELLVQDDLSTLLKFTVIAEGHIVE